MITTPETYSGHLIKVIDMPLHPQYKFNVSIKDPHGNRHTYLTNNPDFVIGILKHLIDIEDRK